MKTKLLAILVACTVGVAFADGYAPGSNYCEQGGTVCTNTGTVNFNSGGTLNIKSGATLNSQSGATFKLGGVTVSATAAELNNLAGADATAADLIKLHDYSGTVTEWNKLDTMTASAAELNALTGAGVSNAEAKILGGYTGSVTELNVLDTLTASAAELNALTGAGVSNAEAKILGGYTGSVTEMNSLDGIATTYTLAAAAESGNVITATVTFKDANAVAVAQRVSSYGFLSGSSTCASELVTAPDTLGPTNGANGYYIDLGAARKGQGLYISDTAGVLIFSVKETGNLSFYLCLAMPTGNVVASAVLDFN